MNKISLKALHKITIDEIENIDFVNYKLVFWMQHEMLEQNLIVIKDNPTVATILNGGSTDKVITLKTRWF